MRTRWSRVTRIRGHSLSRVLALSDGVFAIAATLLVINVQRGSAVTHATFGPALRALRTEVSAYASSVVVIAAFWMGRRRCLAHIELVDQGCCGSTACTWV